MRSISFNRQGYDPFIDFIKAWAIVCVLFGHTFPYLDKVGYSLWAANQVPLFILIQTFHSYKKTAPLQINIKKIISRVFIPFICCEIIVFTLSLMMGNDAEVLMSNMFHWGGYGPGSYYPCVYIQMAILLPLIYPIVKKIPSRILLLLFLIVCEGAEIICSIIDLPDWIYRLLAVRYFFLIYLALLWLKKGIILNWKMLILSIVSLATIVYFRYYSINDEPWFYNTAWKTARWPCYYFVANLYVYVLYWLWKFLMKFNCAMRFIKAIAASTYEIFLVQMSFIYLFHIDHITIVPSGFMRQFIWIAIVWIVSIGLGMIISKITNKATLKN